MAEESTDHLFELAMARHETGELDEAESLYRQILAKNPDDADTLQLVGILNYQRGRHEEALEPLKRAAQLQPEAADCHYHLAVVLGALHRADEAIGSLRTAIKLNGEFPEALELLARTLHEQRKPAEAIPIYRRAIALRPDATESLANLGNALQATGQWAEAAEVCRRVVERRPEDALAWFAVGNAEHMRRALPEAIAAYERALELRTDYVEVLSNLAEALAGIGRLDAAMAACHRALAIQPDYHLALNNLGNVLLELNRVPEAIEAFEKSTVGHPEHADGFYNLGNAMRAAARLEEAAAAYQKATQAQPEMFTAYNNLGIVLKEMRRLPDALWNYHQAIRLRPDHPSPHSNYIYALHFPHGIDQQTIFQEHVVWNARHARKLGRDILPFENDRSGDRRLRVGYVSGDFREHSVGYFLENLFANHDAEQVEIFCYSDVAREDDFTARFRAAAHHWRETGKMDRDPLAAMIREDGIDILVDLAGHTGGSRLPVFARKPAPVQISYLGYPDTTGLTAMDYRITDEFADPVGETERFHTEELLPLPRTFVCYCPNPGSPEVSALPGLASGRVTFGSFNALAKITPPMIAVWAEILKGTPSSRLIIKSHSGLTEPGCRQRLVEIFSACGIGADRVELHSQTPSAQSHLQLYGEIDLALDTFPYHGTTTTCEALWMGVPVVSLAGARHISRVGVSLLSNVGLPKFIAGSTEEYVRIAGQWARDLGGLSKLRGSLREMMRRSPLLDGKQFARDVEAAYRRVWRQWVKTRP